MQITTFFLLDFFGAAFSLTSIYLFTKANKYAWFFSITATLISISLYYQQKIYGYLFLTTFFSFSSLYGFYKWTYKGLKKKELPISRLTIASFTYTTIFILISSISLPWLFKTYTDNSVPTLDGLNMAFCLAAQMLSVHKILETWILWLAVNLIKIALHGISHNIFHAIVHLVSIPLTIIGYRKWKTLYNLQANK